MLKLVVLAQLAHVALGAIGPSASLYIANGVVSPDGFQRSSDLPFLSAKLQALTRPT
jgi:hypothetical protein